MLIEGYSLEVLLLSWLVIPYYACVSCSAPYCKCDVNEAGHVTATCKVARLQDLASFINQPENVTNLYFSVRSDLYILPQDGFARFTALKSLSVANAAITIIASNAFRGLQSLQLLNLSYNRIHLWEGNLTKDLSSLEILDLTGNPSWRPSVNVLELGALQEIRGSTWSDACYNCDLIKNESSIDARRYRQGSYGVYVDWHCRGTEYTVQETTRTFARYGFLPLCFKTQSECYKSEIKATLSHRCWETDNKILNVEYVLGALVIILNVTVVTVTLTSNLKRNVAMLLVSNLAISDFVIGVYTISITASRQRAPYTVFVTFLDRLCSVLGFLWVLGQFVTVQTSILLTAERYVTIIFAMKPNWKPTPRLALVASLVNWVLAVFAAILPLVGIGSYVTNTYCVPMQPSKSVPSSFAYSVGLALYGILLYLITVPLYIHIYLFVRRTSHQAGRVKRDGKIARRIALLVLSNMVFFLTPIVIAVLWLLTDVFKKNISVEARNVLVGVFPTFCFSINSLLNPLLYAFRNAKFKLVLKQKFSKMLNMRQSSVADISLRSRTDSQTTG